MTTIEGASASTVRAATISRTVDTSAGPALPVKDTPGRLSPWAIAGVVMRATRDSALTMRAGLTTKSAAPRQACRQRAKLARGGRSRRGRCDRRRGGGGGTVRPDVQRLDGLLGDGHEKRRGPHLDQAERFASPEMHASDHANRTVGARQEAADGEPSHEPARAIEQSDEDQRA